MSNRSSFALLATLLLIGIGPLVTGCRDLERQVSEGALRNATANGAAAELAGLGYRLEDQLDCRIPPGGTLAVVRVRCVGQTDDGRPVRVDAVAYDADTSHPRQEFVIDVAGQEVMRKHCLGASCRSAASRKISAKPSQI
ncbi:MAG TPA: hypothetical protein VE465_08330 [Streptosporangiaceae bacterium]|jgi:hypothetical protein|nr:hypothetical protein [Streptosporangiaceae bacterium]